MKISGKIVDIHNRRIFKGEISVVDNRIEEINETETAGEVYILPGLIDAHVHVESSMVTPSNFAAEAVRHGTVAVVSDPHEIANVLGVEGVKYMLEDAEKVPLKFRFGAPSCVPATAFESSGAALGAEETGRLLSDSRIGYLAEMMNFPGVIYEEPEVFRKLKIAREMGKPIDGHAPGLTGEQLKKYVNAGISTDHECSSLKEAEEKIALGMKILIREGSAARNLEALAPLLITHPEMVMLCSDDLHPETLRERHLDKIIAGLIRGGYDIFNVIRAASMNAELHYKTGTGLLRRGDRADFVIVGDLNKMEVHETWIDGRRVFAGGKTLFSPGRAKVINNFRSSEISPEELKVMATGPYLRVIVAYNGELITSSLLHKISHSGPVVSSAEEDLLKIVVKERYHDAPPSVAFIHGFGLKSGAFATSVAHDSHNIIAVGVSDSDIAEAVNLVVRSGGGMSVCDGEKRSVLQLPVAGIMSDGTVEETAGKYEQLSAEVKRLGCVMDAPFMTLSFMALLVIPELKLSDSGLFDGVRFRHVSLFHDLTD